MVFDGRIGESEGMYMMFIFDSWWQCCYTTDMEIEFALQTAEKIGADSPITSVAIEHIGYGGKESKRVLVVKLRADEEGFRNWASNVKEDCALGTDIGKA